MEQEITFQPVRLDMPGAIRAIAELSKLPPAQWYVIDFSRLEWIEPFGMLFFARQLRVFRDQRRPGRCRAINHERHGYAAHMGFFQSFGLNFGNEPGEAPGNTQYLPITELTIEDIKREARERFEDPRQIIECRCEPLAGVLARDAGCEVRDTLSYSLREIFRNVLEHSQAGSIWYAAQYWPAKRAVELCILDQGIGIRRSLARNPHVSVREDEDALRVALLPGVSGIAFKGGPRQRRDEWANSGYGLFMTSQLCARGGSFTICSGNRGLTLSGEGTSTFDTGFEGTALRLELFLPEVQALNGSLAALRDRGAQIAGELRHTANLTASMSSRMLAKDFPR
ncbi:hypothetical protein JM946_17355 [Steroidobacter sp. S1-65]|uniref:ATP-binding protein n=1 Tax=Steroidobacter gossypii TaxID=2805490 RepID=A0ABS1WZW6_9GAMM|nr:hypothetical protein [Steroidobacter gossypii]MBM0106499.1 hypothetical protein [Steroidobacter gossypii]